MVAIESYTAERYGAEQAENYLNELYDGFGRIVADPRIGERRRNRTDPFLMASISNYHFAIYHVEGDRIIILTVLHGRQDIETIMQRIRPALTDEINAILNKKPKTQSEG
ncbi:MAG: type II toxin-antitoxin system RelE/ParE family toxin [Cyanobacteria bacterium SBLK]|nr:type II toxin-antitoxin system RelE/ParE family toxin [Cyanobacteria bacterium SBLK]